MMIMQLLLAYGSEYLCAYTTIMCVFRALVFDTFESVYTAKTASFEWE